MTGFGLYVHVPFCRRKCRYCDFCSRPPGEGELDRFVAAVIREASLRPEAGSRIETIYFGGGTPSLLGAGRLAKILASLRERFDVAADAEVTVEANPMDVTPDWAGAVLDAGFHRISVGVQSVCGDDLRFLGRLHAANDGPRAAEAARSVGFVEIGIDLLYGLPRQTAAMLRERIEQAVEFCRPTHVSCYQLTYHEGTSLWAELRAGRIRRHSEDEEYGLFRSVHETLAALGYPAYEVSNFSLGDGHRSRHNQKYWRHVPYLGLGPSAHSFLPPVRSWNTPSVERYFASVEAGRAPVVGRETLTAEQLAAETVMLALRTTDGLDLGAYRERFGRDFLEANRSAVRAAAERGLVAVSDSRLRPTLSGLAVADRLAVEFECPCVPREPNASCREGYSKPTSSKQSVQ